MKWLRSGHPFREGTHGPSLDAIASYYKDWSRLDTLCHHLRSQYPMTTCWELRIETLLWVVGLNAGLHPDQDPTPPAAVPPAGQILQAGE